MEDIVKGATNMAKLLGITRERVYQLCAEPEGMPFIQMKEGRVFVKSEVKEWLKKRNSMLQFKL